MELVFILLPASLFLALIAVLGYGWATRSGQFDDLDTPPLRLLHDEPESTPTETQKKPPSR